MFKVKEIEKEKKMLGKMKGDGELEMLLNEIPMVTSLQNHQSNNPLCMSVSPISSSSFSGGFGSSVDGSSPSLTPSDETTYKKMSTSHWDSVVLKNSNENVVDELGLSENLYRMHIGDEIRRVRLDPDGSRLSDHFSNSVRPCNFENYYPLEGFGRDFHGHGGIQLPFYGDSKSSNDYMKETMVGFPQGCNVGNPMESYFSHSRSNGLYSAPNCREEQIDYLEELRKEQGRGYCNGGIQFQNPSMSKPYINDNLYCSQLCGIDSNGDRNFLNPLHSSQFMHPKLAMSVENPAYNHYLLKQKRREISNSKVHSSLLSMTNGRDVEAFNCEDSFIIQGKSLKYVVDKGCDRSKGRKKNSQSGISMQNRKEKTAELCNQFHSGGSCGNDLGSKSYSTLPLEPSYRSLAEVQGYIYLIAKDQYGCRFLQKIFDEGTRQDVQIIFNEIIDHIVELMMNPFGNYLVQKLLDVCSEEQRMQIVLMVTEEPQVLVRISLNTHGTRVVQKLIETLKTKQQISLIIMALEPGFLDLIKDLNGNHVVQRCLQCLGKEHHKFIFSAAAKFCVTIATHKHGCCVLNRCIAHSTGKHREMLVAQISANGLLLAQDPFGNFVVQFIIELKIPSAGATLHSQFEGHYVFLSMQKFSSHVVEKCLRCFEQNRSRIVQEFFSVPHFDQLLQDPFANYVIQSALEVTKGPLHAALVEAVKPYKILRTSPYCKKLFSRNLLKK